MVGMKNRAQRRAMKSMMKVMRPIKKGEVGVKPTVHPDTVMTIVDIRDDMTLVEFEHDGDKETAWVKSSYLDKVVMN